MDTNKEKIIEYVEKDKSEKISLTIPIAILIAGLFIGGAIIFNGNKNKDNSVQKEKEINKEETKILKEVSSDDDPFLGSPNSPVTIVNFSDYRCGYCARFAMDVEKQIVEKYVKTGKVKFVARDYPFLSQESFSAAEAANCANDQDKFWEYRDYLFSHQSEITSKDNLKKFAKELSLNLAQFDICLESEKYKDEVVKDAEDAISYGVKSTPSNFVNDELILGALPFSEFEKIIESKFK